MKTTKRLLSCLLVLAMLFALAIPAFAAETGHTLTIKNAQKGATYKLYKAFDVYQDASQKGYSYKLPSGVTAPTDKDAAFYTYFKIDQAENIHPMDKAYDDEDNKILSQDAADALYDVVKSTIPQTVNESNGVAQFTNLEDGYYIVVKVDGSGAQEKPAAWLSVDTITGNQEIFDKNPSKPTPPDSGKLKTVDSTTNFTNSDKTEITAKIGEVVPFKIEFVATQYVTEDENDKPTQSPKAVQYYTITDTATSIDVDIESIKVEIGGVQKTVNTDYTVSQANGVTTIQIDWQKKTEDSYNGDFLYSNNVSVVVTYNGTVKAASGSNSAKVGYNGVETPVIPGNTVTVKTFSASVLKFDTADENKAVLNGAEFKLYEQQSGGSPLLFEKTTENDQVTYTLTTKTAGTEGVTDTIEAGNVTIAGLKGGTLTIDSEGKVTEKVAATTYYLEEVKAPDGYNPVQERQPVKFNSVNNTSKVQVDVGNSKGTVLPSTGGIGTTMFYVVGGLLVAAAVVVLVSKKRMGAEQ